MNVPPEVEKTRARITEDGVVLCIRMSEKAPVVDACIAASRGGLKIFEITMTTPGALESIPLSYQERRIYHLHEEIDRMIGIDTIPESLRVTPRLEPFWESGEASSRRFRRLPPP